MRGWTSQCKAKTSVQGNHLSGSDLKMRPPHPEASTLWLTGNGRRCPWGSTYESQADRSPAHDLLSGISA